MPPCLIQLFTLSADYFHEDRKNLLTNSLLPSIIGQSLVQVNEGEATYTGFEANFNFHKAIGKVDLSIFGNYTYSTSKILAINEGAGLPEYQKQLGHPITSVMTTISGVAMYVTFYRRMAFSKIRRKLMLRRCSVFRVRLNRVILNTKILTTMG
jgi:outer membrane receptor protein involved in Fe transport